MTEPGPNNFECESCNAGIEESFEFCPECGALFVSSICENHSADEADGVCIICAMPFCLECGEKVNDKFLCNHHSEYMIRGRMAGVYFSENITEIEYVKSMLNDEGLHPFIYRQEEKIWPGIGTKSMTNVHASEHILMLPFSEVIRAEELIEEMES